MENDPIHSCLKKFFENKFLKHTTFIIVMVVILCIALWASAFIGSMNNFNRGEAYFYKQQYIKAITFFARSMHWYTPFNSYIERSAEYLWEISNHGEKVNDEKLSLIALETIRNSFYSSRSIYSPGINWIDRCERRMRNIFNNQKELIFQENDGDGEYTIYASSMGYNDPNIFWTMILEIGLFCWIGSVICFIFFGLGGANKSSGFIRSYWFWILLIGISYSFWIIGIIKA